MSFVLLTTTDLNGGRDELLRRLFRSLGPAAASHPITVHLLVQRVGDVPLGEVPSFVRVHHHEGRVSLSRARNMLLERLDWDAIASDAIIAYPDDDAFYPDGLLDGVAGLFAQRPQLDFWFCRYASRPEAFSRVAPPVPARAAQVARNASSNTIFVRRDLARAIGGFDESLGVGAPYAGGEDTEYALGAYRRARETLYTAADLVGHRDRLTDLRSRYFPGSLMAIGRHALRDPGIGREFARKVAIGIYMAGHREMPIGTLVHSLLAASGRAVAGLVR